MCVGAYELCWILILASETSLTGWHCPITLGGVIFSHDADDDYDDGDDDDDYDDDDNDDYDDDDDDDDEYEDEDDDEDEDDMTQSYSGD